MQTLKNTKPYVLSVCSGLLLILIFPRFDMEILAWFALVPLFFAIQNQSLAKASLCGFIAGLVFYFFGLMWIINTIVDYGKVPKLLGLPILGILAAYLSFYSALFCYLVRRLSRGHPLYFFLLAPMIWTSLEYIRSTHLEYGFSWLGLGYSQYQTLAVIQIAEFTGVYGVTALIVLVNAALYDLLNCWLSRQNPERLYPKGHAIRVTAILLVALVFCLGYGRYALEKYGAEKPSASKSIRVALVQGNIEQSMKWDPLYRRQVMETYKNLTLKAAAAEPDLIVWPEAATPFFFALDKRETASLIELVRQTQTPLIFGSPYYEKDAGGVTMYNSAYLLTSSGEPSGRYDKIHLVPFGEFVPFKKLLWFVDKMVEGVGDFGRGSRATLFHLADWRFGLSICYEITFPDLIRRPVKAGAQFLVNITNDAWFGQSAASYQHIGMAALRAVENRIPIVRAANTGISGTIDPSGRIRDTTQLFVEDLVLTEILPASDGPTWYTQNGDMFSYACIIMTLVLAGFARYSRKKI